MSFVATSTGSIAPLILFAAVATVTPGGATALATASGSQFGFRRSIPLMAGIALGLASLAAAAAAGLAGVLLAAPVLQTGMKAIGSAYLLWLAWRVARSGAPDLDRSTAAPTTLLGGACLLWLNPKGWAMALGAAASFAMLANGPLHLALLLGGAFGVSAAVSLSLWCAAGVLLARLVRTQRQWRIVNTLLGVLLAVSIVPMWR
ncbi:MULTISPECIES: LysE family translocator [Paraburkholderia]|uniref:LysE family translocator n=1 Tax=Paraburkholderia TaxID=1822464 RepID=UPI00224EF4E2|nr:MULTISPECIES: LysE family transporter [Paraburkholderia]MCX4162272.1 LysE family transporter [Paraburkholderia megapolitana]MDN7157767.1 LysE family transporter [Paraburkholderia sp. CHISQ3]MDQ6494814.1 LysE family transporter [Paraburkholderia megapolitana]